MAVLILSVTGYLFYHSLIASALLSLISLPCEKMYRRRMARRRQSELLTGFRDLLYSLSGSVSAGLKMPQALCRAAEELAVSYGAQSDIAVETAYICRQYGEAHTPIAGLLEDLAARSSLPEIAQFAAAYTVCSESGGDIENVCMRSASLLLDKLQFRSEADAMIAEKKLDLAVLTAMPVVILFFLEMSSSDYMALLYESMRGRLIMSFCLLLIAVSLLAGIKIVDVKL